MIRIPPSSTIPWIALVADISGVCSVFGTLRDHLEADEGGEDEDRQFGEEVHQARPAAFLAPSCTISPSRVMQAPFDDLVVEVELQRAVLVHHQLDERLDVLRVEL